MNQGRKINWLKLAKDHGCDSKKELLEWMFYRYESSEIAEKLNLSRCTVLKHAKKCGVKVNYDIYTWEYYSHQEGFSCELGMYLCYYVHDKLRPVEISDKISRHTRNIVKIHPQTIRIRIRNSGIKMRPRGGPNYKGKRKKHLNLKSATGGRKAVAGNESS